MAQSSLHSEAHPPPPMSPPATLSSQGRRAASETRRGRRTARTLSQPPTAHVPGCGQTLAGVRKTGSHAGSSAAYLLASTSGLSRAAARLRACRPARSPQGGRPLNVEVALRLRDGAETVACGGVTLRGREPQVTQRLPLVLGPEQRAERRLPTASPPSACARSS
jgi:hypothetical protein